MAPATNRSRPPRTPRAMVPVLAALAAAALAALPHPAAADDREPPAAARDVPLPCRPTIACTAEFVAPGELEVELGYAGRQASGAFQHSTPTLVKLTVSEALQLQVGTNGFVAERPEYRYMDGVLVAAKVLLVSQTETVPAIAVSAAVGTPPWRHQHGQDPVVQSIAYASKDALSLHADLNVAANVFAFGGSTRVQPFAALAFSRDLAHGLTPMVEGYLYADASPFTPSDHGLLFALGWAAIPKVVLDAGADWGMGGQERRFTVFVGATVLGPRLWRR
jgi:hypothetical protein